MKQAPRLVWIAALLCGCSTPALETVPDLPPTLAESVRRSMSRVAVVGAGDEEAPAMSLASPPTGVAGSLWGGLVDGGRVGTVGAVATMHGGSEAILIAPAVLLLGAVGGTLVGPFLGPNYADVRKEVGVVAARIAPAGRVPAMTQAITAVGASTYGVDLIATAAPGLPRLEIRVVTVGFAGRSGINPDLYPCQRVVARLLDAGGHELHSVDLHGVRPPKKLAQWAAEDAAALPEALRELDRALAREIVDELFGVHIPGAQP